MRASIDSKNTGHTKEMWGEGGGVVGGRGKEKEKID